MSWRAKRYINRKFLSKKQKLTEMSTRHHVPPQSVGSEFVLEKPWKNHMAYHMIFGDAATYEECCRILLTEWWTPL